MNTSYRQFSDPFSMLSYEHFLMNFDMDNESELSKVEKERKSKQQKNLFFMRAVDGCALYSLSFPMPMRFFVLLRPRDLFLKKILSFLMHPVMRDKCAVNYKIFPHHMRVKRM